MPRRLRFRSVHFVGTLGQKNCCAMPTSDFSCRRNTFFLEVAFSESKGEKGEGQGRRKEKKKDKKKKRGEKRGKRE